MMAQKGSHAAPRGFAFGGKKRAGIAAILAAVLAFAAVGGTIAWLTVSSHVTNNFSIGRVQPVINECTDTDWGGKDGPVHTKENVTVTNKGDSSDAIYVRVNASVYWRDADGSIEWWPTYAFEPGATGITEDYTVTLGNVQGTAGAKPADQGCWIQGDDGYFYWSRPLEAGATTDALIDRFEYTANTNPPEEGMPENPIDDSVGLVVDFVAQGIQANPADAAVEAWGVTIDANGTLTPKAGAADTAASSAVAGGTAASGEEAPSSDAGGDAADVASAGAGAADGGTVGAGDGSGAGVDGTADDAVKTGQDASPADGAAAGFAGQGAGDAGDVAASAPSDEGIVINDILMTDAKERG